MFTSWNKLLIAAFLVGVAGSASAKMAYKPDDVAQFNLSNQCNACDLSGASLSGNHSNAAIVSSNLTGAKISGTFSASVFYGSNLSSSDWSGANISYVNFSYTPLVKAKFNYADLSYANFEGALTNDAVFDHANLYGSNISQSQLDASGGYCWATLPNGTKKNC